MLQRDRVSALKGEVAHPRSHSNRWQKGAPLADTCTHQAASSDSQKPRSEPVSEDWKGLGKGRSRQLSEHMGFFPDFQKEASWRVGGNVSTLGQVTPLRGSKMNPNK